MIMALWEYCGNQSDIGRKTNFNPTSLFKKWTLSWAIVKAGLHHYSSFCVLQTFRIYRFTLSHFYLIGYTLKRSNWAVFMFASLIHLYQLFRKKLHLKEQILFFQRHDSCLTVVIILLCCSPVKWIFHQRIYPMSHW